MNKFMLQEVKLIRICYETINIINWMKSRSSSYYMGTSYRGTNRPEL
jgi:hypothetical protein